MYSKEYSLLYLSLGNKFRISEYMLHETSTAKETPGIPQTQKNLNIAPLEYINFLISETQIHKIEIEKSRDLDLSDNSIYLNINCLCSVPNKNYGGVSLPDKKIIGGLNLLTKAGNHYWLIDEEKAFKKFIDEYVKYELAEEYADYLSNNLSSIEPWIFHDDWNVEEVSLEVKDKLNEVHSLDQFENIFDFEGAKSSGPQRLGFYSWLFHKGALTRDILSTHSVQAEDMVHSTHSPFSELRPRSELL